jgi:hypothetical protein
MSRGIESSFRVAAKLAFFFISVGTSLAMFVIAVEDTSLLALSVGLVLTLGIVGALIGARRRGIRAAFIVIAAGGLFAGALILFFRTYVLFQYHNAQMTNYSRLGRSATLPKSPEIVPRDGDKTKKRSELFSCRPPG